MAQNQKDGNAGKHHSGLEAKTGKQETTGKNTQFNSGSGSAKSNPPRAESGRDTKKDQEEQGIH